MMNTFKNNSDPGQLLHNTNSEIARLVGSAPLGEVLRFEDLHIGLTVVDQDDPLIVGTVENIDDKHNVKVSYAEGGSGLYCLDTTCLEYEPLLRHVNKINRTRRS